MAANAFSFSMEHTHQFQIAERNPVKLFFFSLQNPETGHPSSHRIRIEVRLLSCRTQNMQWLGIEFEFQLDIAASP